MKRIILLTIVTLISAHGFSQKYASKYKKLLEPNSKLIDSGFNFTLEELQNGNFIYKTYYPENKQITKIVSFKSSNFKVKSGKYAEYYDDGTLIKFGSFLNDKKDGDWIESNWYGKYENDNKHGNWIQKNTIKDSVAILQEKSYSKGELHGKHIIYDSLGVISLENIYEYGVLISSKEDTTNTKFTVVEQMPQFPGCEGLYNNEEDTKKCADKTLLNYIYRNIKYPPKAIRQNAQGEALVTFVIDKDGSVNQIKILRGITKEIAKECVRLVQKMPKWKPGMVNGEPVKVQFNLPIKFRLK